MIIVEERIVVHKLIVVEERIVARNIILHQSTIESLCIELLLQTEGRNLILQAIKAAEIGATLVLQVRLADELVSIVADAICFLRKRI